MSELMREFPRYEIIKEKLDCPSGKIKAVLKMVRNRYQDFEVDLQDGVKVNFPGKNSWLHVRGSNTEPIIRLVAEAPTLIEANELLDEIRLQVAAIIGVE